MDLEDIIDFILTVGCLAAPEDLRAFDGSSTSFARSLGSRGARAMRVTS